jgi:transcriptional regulator with XRE-family HTH domain
MTAICMTSFEFSSRIRALNLTARDFARYFNIKENTIAVYALGKRAPNQLAISSVLALERRLFKLKKELVRYLDALDHIEDARVILVLPSSKVDLLNKEFYRFDAQDFDLSLLRLAATQIAVERNLRFVEFDAQHYKSWLETKNARHSLAHIGHWSYDRLRELDAVAVKAEAYRGGALRKIAERGAELP